MTIGTKVKVKDNLFKRTITGIVAEIEICYFRILTEDGLKTYHWNDDIEIEEYE